MNEIAKRIKKEYPEYNKFEDEALIEVIRDTKPELYKIALQTVHIDDYSKAASEIDAELRALDFERTKQRGFFGGLFGSWKAENESEIAQLTNERIEALLKSIQLRTDIFKAQLDMLAAPERHERQLQLERWIQELERQKYMNSIGVATQANNEKLDLSTYIAKEARRIQDAQELERIDRLGQLAIDRLKKENDLEVQKKKELDDLELSKEKRLAHDEIEANLTWKYMEIPKQIDLLQRQIDEKHAEVARLESTKALGWQKMVADREKTIRSLQEAQNGLRAELRQSNKQEKVGRNGTPTEVPRDPR